MLKIAVRCSQSLLFFFFARFFSPPFFARSCVLIWHQMELEGQNLQTERRWHEGTWSCVFEQCFPKPPPAAVRTVWEKSTSSSLASKPTPSNGKLTPLLFLLASQKHPAIPPLGPRGRLHRPVPPISSSGFLPLLGFLWRTCN